MADNKDRTAAIMDTMAGMKDEAPATPAPMAASQDGPSEEIVAAEDIKAGDKIRIEGGMAYSNSADKGMGDKPMDAGAGDAEKM
jgi:hypothetical protein